MLIIVGSCYILSCWVSYYIWKSLSIDPVFVNPFDSLFLEKKNIVPSVFFFFNNAVFVQTRKY